MSKIIDKATQEKSDQEIRHEGKLAKLRRDLEEAKRRERAQKIRADEADKLIADFHASKFDIKKQKIRKHQGKGSFVRVAFGDTHGCSLDKDVWAAFLADMEFLQPKQVVHTGDILDCGGWLASHHTTNYVAQTDYSYSDEIVGGNIMCDQLQERCPGAEMHFIEGNHDGRIATWALTTTQKHRADSELLISLVAVQNVLHLEKRGIQWVSRGDCHGDSVAGGTLKLGRCYFTHPSSSSKHHAAKMAESFGKNVVFAHTHRADFYPSSNVQGEEWAAWNPGCMCVKRKYWHHTSLFRHSNGYHVQLVQSDGSFLGINVPIINGKSYLSGLLKLG